jgi:hypothetical protein
MKSHEKKRKRKGGGGASGRVAKHRKVGSMASLVVLIAMAKYVFMMIKSQKARIIPARRTASFTSHVEAVMR